MRIHLHTYIIYCMNADKLLLYEFYIIICQHQAMDV